MKKSITSLVYALLLLSGSTVYANNFSKAPSRNDLKIERNGYSFLDLKMAHDGLRSIGTSHESLARSGAPITEIISNPKGEEVNYDKKSAGTFVLNGVMGMYLDNFPASIVWGDNNKVYFKNLLSTFPADVYVEGTLEGNKISVPTDQTVDYYEQEGYGINFGVLKSVFFTENGEEKVKFEYAPEIKSVEFVVSDDGNLEMVLPCEPFNGQEPTEYVAGYYFTDDYSFTGYCDFYQDYKRLELQLVTMPQGAEILPYVYIDSHNYASKVEVAFVNDYIYIKGLNHNLPEGTIRGKLSGNNISIPQNEYLGIYFDQYYIFTKVLLDNPDFNPDDENSPLFIFAPADMEFKMVYDPETRSIISTNEDVYLSFHGDDQDYTNTLGLYSSFELKYQSTFAGIPANPAELEYTTNFVQYQGFNDFFFTLSNFSTKGTLLDTDKLYYVVYVDGGPLIFHEEETIGLNGKELIMYEGVPIETYYMPYHFENNFDIFKYAENVFDVGIYFEGVTTIGVQAMYFFDNVYNYSDIVTLDVDSGEITTTPWENAGIATAVKEEVISSEYYGLDGRKISNPDKGIYIKVMKTASGKTVVKKVSK